MNNQSKNTLTPYRLKYKKGDLVIKEGDYGISMYKILSGRIQVLAESADLEIPLASLGEGDVIGEMIFLDKSIERRTASARALEDSELELWHPDMIVQEYEQMPPILKLIADQTLARLNRMNRLVPQLIGKRRKPKAKPEPKDPWASHRRFYRKKVSMRAHCRALDAAVGGRMEGEIRDISLAGVGLAVKVTSIERFPYKKDHLFEIQTTLPNGKELEFHAKVVSVGKGEPPGTVFMGMSITSINDQSSKDLGFFLMPA